MDAARRSTTRGSERHGSTRVAVSRLLHLDQGPAAYPSGRRQHIPGPEPSVWTYDEAAGAYYYHRFYHHQPSLNPTSPHVLEEVQAIADFWLSVGADALRMDAVSHMIEGSPLPETQPEAPEAILRDLRSFLDRRSPDAAVMGEADEPAAELDRYFGEGDQLHMLMNFLLNNYLFLSFVRRSASPLRTALDLLPAIPPTCQWANFLRNLDEVDLERLRGARRTRDSGDGRALRVPLVPRRSRWRLNHDYLLWRHDRAALSWGYEMLLPSLEPSPSISRGRWRPDVYPVRGDVRY